MMEHWNPELYLKFRRERTQPSIDLIARIAILNPDSILDVGCGPGNSTQMLAQRWPQAQITGIDSSPEMIRKARAEYPRFNWILGDAAAFVPERRWDIVFSNATLQWIPEHEKLVPRLYSWVNEGGVLAVQVPANDGSPLHRALTTVAKRERWQQRTAGCIERLHYHPASYYYAILSGLSPRIELWETTYYHLLPSQQALLDWYRGTGMRPFLEQLATDAERETFQREVLDACREDYRPQQNRTVIFPFQRLFMVVYNGS